MSTESGAAVGTAMARGRPNAVYGEIYNDTRSMIMVLSGLSETALNGAATELSVDYEVFLADYHGIYLVDAYVGFAEMLRQWPSPWPAVDEGALNGLTVAQFFLIWAWQENDSARYFLEGEAIASGWGTDDAMSAGVTAAVSAAKSLFHAKYVMAFDADRLGQESAGRETH